MKELVDKYTRNMIRAGLANNPLVCGLDDERTVLHDLPVIHSFSAETVLSCLRKRKSVIIAEDHTIRVVTFGTVSPEQAFVTFSSVCFSSFVLFFADYLDDLRKNSVTNSRSFSPWTVMSRIARNGASAISNAPENGSSATYPSCPVKSAPARPGFATPCPRPSGAIEAPSSGGTACSPPGPQTSTKRSGTCLISKICAERNILSVYNS
jgi:hypothetical protein